MDELKPLIIKAQQGNVDAYEEVVVRFQQMALNYAFSILRDSHLAEDVVQEAFVNGFQRLVDLKVAEAFPSWFRRIVFKYCDRLIRRKQVDTVTMDYAFESCSSQLGPDHVLTNKELKKKIMTSIQELPQRQRITTTLYYVDGFSQKQVAEFLDVPITTVKKRLSSARKALKASMSYLDEKD